MLGLLFLRVVVVAVGYCCCCDLRGKEDLWVVVDGLLRVFIFEIDLFFNYRRYFFNCSSDFNSVRRWLIVARSTTVGEKTISKVKRAIFKEHI